MAGSKHNKHSQIHSRWTVCQVPGGLAVKSGGPKRRVAAVGLRSGRNGRQYTLAEKLEARIVRGPGCWVVAGFVDASNRYPLIAYGGAGSKRIPAHRLAWELAHGPIPDGLNVCHKCDNPRCARVDHLFLGTQKQNVHDAMQKGRHISVRRRLASLGLERVPHVLLPVRGEVVFHAI